jgi:hypothetical protein
MYRRSLAMLTAGALLAGAAAPALAGSFIGSLGSNSSLQEQEYILHPIGYLNDAQTALVSDVTVNLCIVPGSPNAAAMVTPVANIARVMTAKAGRTGNLLVAESGDPVPFSQWDFESVALHEVGHCLGLGHVNAATESGLPPADRDYTKAAVGGNGILNIDAGTDARRGSSDDIRSDDVSVHWFRLGTNDPCGDPGTTTFDSTTYTVDTASLPAGDTFTANADQGVCSDLGVPNTEAVMQQGSPNGQSQRFLGHSGEAMLRLGMSGLDEIQGTSDDYTLTVESLGISDSPDCDVNLSFNNAQTGFAVCGVSFASFINPSNHGVMFSANAFFNSDAVPWFFNTTSNDSSGFSVGGTVSGLAGSGLVLQNNAGDDLAIAGNGSFTFATRLGDTEAYSVTVQTQPSDLSQTCSVTNGSGVIAGADVTNVAVNCVTDTFTVGGTVSGLAGTGLVLQNNAGDDLVISGNGSFTFGTPLDDGSGYSVSVLTQPTGPAQTCAVGNPSGTLDGSNVTNVTITCVTAGFTVGGTVSGLDGTGLVLTNNGGDDLTITGNGAFTFGTPLSGGEGYAVAVSVQPSDLSQTCSVTNGSGTVASANVTDVAVNCVTDTFTVGGDVSGLLGSGLVLQNNGGDDLAVGADGSFTFSTPLVDGSDYQASIASQPQDPAQTCVISSGSGTLAGSGVTDIAVVCRVNCLTNEVSGVTDTGTVNHEACDALSIGPNYTAESGADVFWSGGTEIRIFPDTRIEEGATGTAATCGQSLCEASTEPMPQGCNSCVDAICAVDDFCCGAGDGFYDSLCVLQVEATCNLSCN